MATLYAWEQGTMLRKEEERLVISRGNERLREVPAIKIDRVVVMGRGVQVTTATLMFLARQGVAVIYTNEEGTRYALTMSSGPANNTALRLAQARLIDQPARALPLVRAIVDGKLHNQIALLRERAAVWPTALAPAVATLEQVRRDLGRAGDADAARGYEGAGAAAYWRAWTAALRADWHFGGRAQHPPPDPVNALLSFGYTLLLNELIASVQKIGLDPGWGFFHVIEYGRPSLALDLEEEFRALIVDPLVLDLLAARAVSRTDFAPPAAPPGALYLTAPGRERVVAAYEERLRSRVRHPETGKAETWRHCLTLQTEHLARVIGGTEPVYRPLRAPAPAGA